MRIPLPATIKSRNGTADKDSRMVNVLAEKRNASVYGAGRPGLSSGAATSGAKNGQGVTDWNATLIAIYSGYLYKPSGGVMGSGTALPSASTTLQFDFTQSTT